MKIFIMRHGDATIEHSTDAKRCLSELGYLEAKVMAKWLNTKDVKIDAVIASPFVRAEQTAKAVIEELTFEPVLQQLDLLTPSGDASRVHDYIDAIIAIEHYQNILLVSHMPLVSYLLAELSVEKSSSLFSTAAIAEIDYDTKKMAGHITHHVSPDDFC
ncbi:phosphohistidine phosphatase SixA [Thalassotalea crassostreae]|uniref:phosphohistidine phosphatase SixA n=1 Tax=Thalassotalea crassostreae TaxID=1763536 RepID=UPI000837ED43|nr:phosphohistidine phosphatase SixA [Thalassotalea crassostreae]